MSQRTILVIDDEDDISNAIARALKKEGFGVITASNYKTAINIIDNSTLDLVISDVMMPYTGGFDIVEYVKENPNLKHLPVILVTGMDKDILYSSSIKANAILQKPFDTAQLMALVKSNLKQPAETE
ncbi:MAG: response regulator [Bacteroidia bacterium]